MSEAKFTKGPWVAEPPHASWDPIICMVAGLVITCKETDYDKIDNANLIAAAPELYEALAELLDAIGGRESTDIFCKSAVAALAKARGETL